MENKSVFHFKQFSIAHHHCAMKVGADAVLLGAWATIPPNCKTVLDIGTGSGVIALMLAQRTPDDTQIWGIEIDPPASNQAAQNAQASPWKHRVTILQADFTQFTHLPPSGLNLPDMFSLIVTNPPYFHQHLPAANQERTTARHTHQLSFEQLLSGVVPLLHPQGYFCLILPHPQGILFRKMAEQAGLFCCRATAVHTLAHKPVKRWLLQFAKTPPSQTTQDVLVMGNAHPTQFTPDCKQLTQDFYTVL